MNTSLAFVLLLVGCTIVTLLPRILPFILVRNFTISKPIKKWLSYIPICIFTGLIVESLLAKTNSGLAINWTVLAAAIPTCLIAIFTKSLLTTVLVGVFSMAIIRFFF
ncbi:AzlD domain-containing protein [Niallia nealsonii]|uniref:Branched-chain amino acid transporter AzlD n=1 Tax=Niallia nealsonii TaxID=115979 RepID=A0A2N0Z6H0_9BACI|nr:AzlD domain-containing protein [Niallia nealsonii]PKG25099.1 branched-chain amino acid transporter AzlD [Niallia nealsonii]